MVAERRHLLAQIKLLEAKLERAETQLQQHQHRECKLLGFSVLADIWLHSSYMCQYVCAPLKMPGCYSVSQELCDAL